MYNDRINLPDLKNQDYFCPKGYCVRDDWVWDKEIDV